KIPNGGTDHAPLDLHVGNAGTAARFLSALLCLGGGVYRLSGVPRMHERPQAELFHALRQLGYRIEPERRDDRLPARIFGQGPKSGKCSASIQESSQFASALLLCRKAGGWEVQVTGENAEESPYVAMTSKMTEAFPYHGGTFQIEPDASSGSYFRAADWLFAATSDGFGKITVRNWPKSGWQIDAAFPAFLPLPESISRNGQLGDSIMTAIVLAADERTERGPRAHGKREKIHFTDLDRLRVQECDRVLALRTELRKCGAKIVEKGDTLTIHPSQLHGSEIETYNDHRMAMCFAILGLKIPGIKIKNPACVKKTFPNFFQKLAAAPPTGLGVSILEADTGRPLRLEELFAH
ncbi:MAG: hypothetical protein KGR98_05070, partial [Verrucomicrobia bacterium]|nr:hypothetical protein [Verrucomicrobiota bacterium]